MPRGRSRWPIRRTRSSLLLTALHGIHLLGGLWVWARATARVLRGAEVEKVRLSVELCTVYWHFLLPGLGGPVRGIAEYPSIERIGPHDAIGGHRIGRSDCRWLPAWKVSVADWSSDQRAFKKVPWGKAMMWIFLLSDTFIFSSFLISYMTVRMSTQATWLNPSEVFALTIGGKSIPLILIAIMTFVLISSSGTMVLAVNYGYRKDQSQDLHLPAAHRGIGRHVRGHAGVRVDQADRWRRAPWAQSMGAAQFGSSFFMITGFHGTHVTIGVIFLIIVADQGDCAETSTCRAAGVSDRQERQLRDRRNAWACTGTSSIWCGYSSSHFSISGKTTMAHAEGQHHAAAGTRTRRGGGASRRRAATSARHLFQDLGLAVRAQHRVLPGRLLPLPGISPVVAHHRIHAAEGRADRRRLMHMLWERLAMVYAILLPPLLLMVLLGIGAGEADYTFFTRNTFFGPAAAAPPPAKHP